MKESYWVGTSPFCGGNKSDCGRTPGYLFSKYDKKGDGKRCLTGQKAKCTFNSDAWGNSEEFKKIRDDFCPNISSTERPEFKWFGTSPICDITDGEVAAKGYYPLKHDNSGDGAPCVKGYKILGMKPVCQKMQDEVDRLIGEYRAQGSPTTLTRILDFILNNIPDNVDPRFTAAKKGVKFLKDVTSTMQQNNY